jgi:hypothetical protein
MDNNDFTYKSNYRQQKMPSCTCDLDYFKALFETLKVSTEEGANIEIAKLKKKDEDSDEAFEKLKVDAKSLYKVAVHIFGSKGEYIYAESSSIFDDPGLPEAITKITFDNSSKFKAILQKREPINKFRIVFDFSKPVIFDFNSSPSLATPNNSFISVLGENDTWVSGVYNKIMESLKDRANRRGWLHRNNIYDFFLWFLVIPLNFRLLYNINKILPSGFSGMSDFFKAACYLYFFIVILYLFRMLFNYVRWIFPNIEVIRNVKKGAIGHRAFLGVILSSIALGFLYDFVKTIFFN